MNFTVLLLYYIVFLTVYVMNRILSLFTHINQNTALFIAHTSIALFSQKDSHLKDALIVTFCMSNTPQSAIKLKPPAL